MKISHIGRYMTVLRWDGKYYTGFVENVILFQMVKKLWKLVNVWLSYHRICIVTFFTFLDIFFPLTSTFLHPLSLRNEDGSNWLRDYLSALTMRSDWFFLVLVTFRQVIHCILQTKTKVRAVAEKPHDAVHSFNVLKFTAASRGPPCDSTASCFTSFVCSNCFSNTAAGGKNM